MKRINVAAALVLVNLLLSVQLCKAQDTTLISLQNKLYKQRHRWSKEELQQARAFAVRQHNDTLLEDLCLAEAAHRKDSVAVARYHEVVKLATKHKDLKREGAAYQLLGYAYYDRNSDTSMQYYSKAALLFNAAKNKQKVALSYQSIAFIYDEKRGNNNKAALYAGKAISLYTQLKDTLPAANMYKYEGMLLGRLKRYEEARENVNKAIILFRAGGFEPGVIVSYFDMANVFESENKPDSALHYLLMAKEYWQREGTTERLYVINTALLRNYLRLGNMPEAKAVYTENAGIDNGSYWSNRLKFYQVSQDYFIKDNMPDSAKLYKDKFLSLKDSLITKGIEIPADMR